MVENSKKLPKLLEIVKKMNNFNLGINISSTAKNFFYFLFVNIFYKQFWHAAHFFKQQNCNLKKDFVK